MTNCVHIDRPTTKALLQSELFLTKDQVTINKIQSDQLHCSTSGMK
jgi:hypothetical protein